MRVGEPNCPVRRGCPPCRLNSSRYEGKGRPASSARHHQAVGVGSFRHGATDGWLRKVCRICAEFVSKSVVLRRLRRSTTCPPRAVNPSRKLRRFESFTCHHVRGRALDLRKRRSGTPSAASSRCPAVIGSGRPTVQSTCGEVVPSWCASWRAECAGAQARGCGLYPPGMPRARVVCRSAGSTPLGPGRSPPAPCVARPSRGRHSWRHRSATRARPCRVDDVHACDQWLVILTCLIAHRLREGPVVR